jgi:hypothetical protein
MQEERQLLTDLGWQKGRDVYSYVSLQERLNRISVLLLVDLGLLGIFISFYRPWVTERTDFRSP